LASNQPHVVSYLYVKITSQKCVIYEVKGVLDKYWFTRFETGSDTR